MIDSFTGKYEFLSNFYPVLGALTVEHLYHASKSLDPIDQHNILQSATAGRAKRLGRRVLLRPNWDNLRIPIMYGLLNWKFSLPNFRTLLLETEPHDLVEGNRWHDTFWGVCQGGERCRHDKPEGANNLGLLLMQVRAELLYL